MELVMIRGKLYWFNDFDGESIDGIAVSAFSNDIAMKKDDVYYIFENAKSELANWFDTTEKEMVKHFFDNYPYSMESCPKEFIHHRKAA